MRAYSRKNGWKPASPLGDRNDGRMMGSLLGICGRVFRDPLPSCLDTDRDDDVSPEPDFDIFNLTPCK